MRYAVVPPKRRLLFAGETIVPPKYIVAPENWKNEAASKLRKPLFVPMLPEPTVSEPLTALITPLLRLSKLTEAIEKSAPLVRLIVPELSSNGPLPEPPQAREKSPTRSSVF